MIILNQSAQLSGEVSCNPLCRAVTDAVQAAGKARHRAAMAKGSPTSRNQIPTVPTQNHSHVSTVSDEIECEAPCKSVSFIHGAGKKAQWAGVLASN